MAKRFTDTEKWKNPSFREMEGVYRWLWIYLLDNCDAAGIWRVDFSLASYCIGEKISSREAQEYFEDKIVVVDHDKWFIPSFIEFQYGELKEESRPHLSVIKILVKNGIDPKKLTLLEQYPNGIQTLKDKEQDKEQDKVQDKEQEKERSEIKATADDYEAVYQLYTNKRGKSEGLEKLKKRCPTKPELEKFKQAMLAYLADCATENRFVQQFSTFANSRFDDWLDPEVSASSNTQDAKPISIVDILAEQKGRGA